MRFPRKLVVGAAAVVLALAGTTVPSSAVSGHGKPGHGEPEMEKLARGLVAMPTDRGVYLSWRLLGHEVDGHTKTGMSGPDFRVYRDGERIATVRESTTYRDAEGSADARYRVAPIVDGEERRPSEPVTPASERYLDIPLDKPAPGVTPAGEEYTYTANDVSVGDVDGDGAYEYVVKWEPTNAKDVSQVGYTGPTYIDTYERDGTLLWRLDLGVNIRSGAHYTQFLSYDFDDDGRAELMLKTAPGTRAIRYDEDGDVASERYITMPRSDRRAGYSHADDYRMSAADYYDHVVEMFRSWHEHPEVRAGNWPATLEEAFGLEPTYDYPLSNADARKLTDYFMDVYAPSRSERNDLRNFEGYVLSGPEYLTVFDGATGRELDTRRYKPGRGDDGLMWGDYAMSRIEPGNRVDRFLAGVAYLDGKNPSAVFARGYYTRAAIAAYDFDGKRLKKRWYVDSGHVPMSNPFDASPHGKDGTDPEFGRITTQGAHSFSAADVDGDGRQEIVYGAATIDHDGSLLYSSFDVAPEQSEVPGQNVRLGHGDALHVTDVDPNRPGLEIYMAHESGPWAPYGYTLRDAETGEVIYGAYTGRDTGRGMVGDVVPGEPGLETWASDSGINSDARLWTADGRPLGADIPGTNQSIRWAGDLTTQLINGVATETLETPTIDDWRRGTLLTATGTLTNNWTKGNPALVADVLGDWREEMLVRTTDSSALRIYVSTEPTEHTMYTLMHDPQYRVGVARQQTGYNQPAYPGFYLGSGMDWSQVPVPGRPDRHRGR